MMASPQVFVDNPRSMSGASVPGSVMSMTKTRGILLETMQLVENVKPEPVPNHLLETKIYAKLERNDYFQAKPAVIHFAGYDVGQQHTLPLRIFNVSNDVQRMHIIPPQTKYFKIHYKKPDRLVAGMSLDCIVEFVPDEYRYYYDAIRIHSKGEENLVVPIHAYPVMNADDFPSHITFPPVPVGHSVSRAVPLRCSAPIDFEYELNVPQPHPAFSIDPIAGIVPANGEVEVNVTFSPTEFSTAYMLVELIISQFNSKPLVCHITGSSLPGLAKALTEMSIAAQREDDSILDPRSITPVDRARKRRQRKVKDSGSEVSTNQSKVIVKDGIRFPANLDTPYAVGVVLNQEPGKLNMKDLRSAVVSKSGKKQRKQTKQMKEAVFEMAIRKEIYEERQNQLRWQVKLGESPMINKRQNAVLADREASWNEYKRKRGDPDVDTEYARRSTECSFRRTTRQKDELASKGVKFDLYSNDMWGVRHSALGRFRQAARKIIIRRRGEIKLNSLKSTILDWGRNKGTRLSPLRGAYTLSAETSVSDSSLGEKSGDNKGVDINMDISRIQSFTFPTYVQPNVKDDMAVDALGPVPYMPTTVVIKRKYDFFHLKVPQQYKLQGYQRHNTHDSSQSFVCPTLARPLRKGAEDEEIVLPPEPKTSRSARPPPAEREHVIEGDLRVEDVVSPAPSSSALTLNPPSAMFRPIDYPPLHIFVS